MCSSHSSCLVVDLWFKPCADTLNVSVTKCGMPWCYRVSVGNQRLNALREGFYEIQKIRWLCFPSHSVLNVFISNMLRRLKGRKEWKIGLFFSILLLPFGPDA